MKVIKISEFGNYGIFIDNIDFENLSHDEWMEIGRLHAKNLVTIIRNANVQPKNISYWTNKWGPRRHSGMLTIIKAYPDLTIDQIVKLGLRGDETIKLEHQKQIQDRFKIKGPGGSQRVTDKKKNNGDVTGMFPDGELYWHSNEAGNLVFAPGVALLGQENMKGSCTGFLQTADYYEDISESFRSELDEMIVIHKWQEGKIHEHIHSDQEELMRLNMIPEDESRIPMVIQSPGGIKGLHYSINTVWGIDGMSKKDSDKLFEKINKDLMTDKYIYDYWYENDNDWLFFDNSIVNHRRLGTVKNRLAFRIQQGYEHIAVNEYNPYYQPEFANLYRQRINEFTKYNLD